MPILGFLIIAVHTGAMTPRLNDVDENGNPVGFAIGILEEIAKRAGVRFTEGTARWSQEFAPMPTTMDGLIEAITILDRYWFDLVELPTS